MESNQSEIQDFVYRLAASPDYEQDGLLFSAKQSGLFRSRDGGQTWEDAFASLNLEAPLPTTFVALTQDSDNAAIVYACVEGNVLRSMDGGEMWEVSELGSPPPVITSLVVSPNFAADSVLLAGTMQDGVFRSTNRGANWTGWNFGLFDPNINALAVSPNFAADQTILAGTQSGVFLSLNAGRSWRDLDFPLDSAPVLEIAIQSSEEIYVGSEEDGLFHSPDGGKTWHQLLSGSVEQVLCQADGKLLAIIDAKIRISVDGGRTWQTPAGFDIDGAVSCLAAPRGLHASQPIWVGFANGQVLKFQKME